MRQGKKDARSCDGNFTSRARVCYREWRLRFLAFNNHDVRIACMLSRYSVTGHARQRLGQRKMCASDLVVAMASYCEILEHYTDHIPFGNTALVLTRMNDRWIHVVCAHDEGGTLHIQTAYEPDPLRWSDERTRKAGEGESR